MPTDSQTNVSNVLAEIEQAADLADRANYRTEEKQEAIARRNELIASLGVTIAEAAGIELATVLRVLAEHTTLEVQPAASRTVERRRSGRLSIVGVRALPLK